MYVNKNGTWKSVTDFFINVSGTWKRVTEAFINVSGTWKRFWTGISLQPLSPVEISQSTDTTTYLTTLTGKNYYWSPGPPSLTYYFEWSTNGGTTWTTLSTGSAINPAYGSSTSYTHQITTSQFSGNVTNTYRFRVYATYGSQTANSSATTTIQGPTNITLTAGDTGASSIPINWTASTGAYRYLVEYKTNTSSTWSTFSWTGTTYETITGLAEGTLYNVRVTPYTSQSNNSTYKGYAGNTSNIVNATTKVTPGNLSRVENYNFDGSMQQGFFTTGTNTTRVLYYFNCVSIPSLSVPTYTQNTNSGIPYKIQQNLLNYFTLKTWNYDTYGTGAGQSIGPFYAGNTVWYAGNQYTANYVGSNTGFSGQVPTNTIYWTKTTTITYNIGDYVLYNGSYYFCKSSTNGTYPTNTTYWIANSVSFQMYATPYNVDIMGNTSSAASNITVNGNGTYGDPLRISSGPSFSNITTTTFLTSYIPSVYTNQVDFYIYNTATSTYVTGYNPKILSATGATTNTHTNTTSLSPITQYLVTINSRYVYDATYGIFHNGSGASNYVTTIAPIPDPPTGLSVSDVGTNRPYNNAAYDLSWTAPTYTGGIALTGYKIQFQIPSTGTTWYDYSSNTVDTSSTSIRLTGFGSNLSTNFRVYSVNSAGQSATAVATTSAILGTTVPQAPTIGSATSANTYISVTYTAPSGTGGKAITSYTATSSPGSLTGSTSSGAIQVFNVVHNTAYTFTVTATNANGTSASSSASNTAYGVNIGSVTNITSSSTTTNITLYFTKASNSTSTRGYYNNSFDGSNSGTSYTFYVGSPSTSASLGLAGIATVNGTLYEGPRTTNTYSTSALPAVTVNSYPTISGSGAVNTNITFGSGSYNNASSISKTLRVSTTTSFSTSSGNKGSTSPYTVTSSDAAAPAYYFATLDTVVGTNGLTYYFWSGGYSGSSVTIPAGSGSILSYAPSGTAPNAPSNGGGTYSSGTNYVTNATFTRSTSGTTPITYYWSVYKATANGQTGTLVNSGTISSSTLGGTQSIPQQSWTQVSGGNTYNWAHYSVYASNSYGTSSTLDWWI